MAKVIRNLTDEDIQAVCHIIVGWPSRPKLTWQSLIEAIEMRLYRTWTRQALDRHEKIKEAYTEKRDSQQRSAPSKDNDDSVPPDMRKMQERILRLESEIERLNRENGNLIEKFRIWSTNAFAKGITEDMLNKPIPEGNHRSTRDDR